METCICDDLGTRLPFCSLHPQVQTSWKSPVFRSSNVSELVDERGPALKGSARVVCSLVSARRRMGSRGVWNGPHLHTPSFSFRFPFFTHLLPYFLVWKPTAPARCFAAAWVLSGLSWLCGCRKHTHLLDMNAFACGWWFCFINAWFSPLWWHRPRRSESLLKSIRIICVLYVFYSWWRNGFPCFFYWGYLLFGIT